MATLEDAAITLAGVAACFADRIGGLWTQTLGRRVSINAATSEFVLEVSRTHPGKRRTGGPTHHVPLVARPGQAPIGGCEIRVVSNEPGGAASALRVSLEAPVFDLEPEALLALTGAVADAMVADEACLRPQAWASGPASWAVLACAARVLRGGVSRRCGRGLLVVLHDGAPTDEKPEAKQRSEAELSRLLADTAVRAGDETMTVAVASAETPSAPPRPLPAIEPAPPVIAVQLPTFLAPSRPALSGTALSLDIPRGPALPFAKSTGDQPAPPSPTLPHINRAPAELSGTAMMLDLPIGPALPFAPGDGAPPLPPPTSLPRVSKAPAHLSATMSVLDLPAAAVLPFVKSTPDEPPELTLEEYAALRANLTVKGEDDPGTWKEFGIASHAMKEALQVRFAARFRDDPEARDRFVALVQRMVSDLRGKALGG